MGAGGDTRLGSVTLNITQDTFNKLVTSFLFLFFAGIYIYSLVTGKSVNWQELLGFLVPTLNHIAHQYSGTAVQVENIKADASKSVASSAVNGKDHS